MANLEGERAMDTPSKCRECGGTKLTWTIRIVNPSGIVNGRLRTHDVSAKAVCGCDECSETLRVVDAEDYLRHLEQRLEEMASCEQDIANAPARNRA